MFRLNFNVQPGDIVKMNVGKHSHVTKPYYVLVEYYNPFALKDDIVMVTAIPGRHKVEIRNNENWAYHGPRMERVSKQDPELLLNQALT